MRRRRQNANPFLRADGRCGVFENLGTVQESMETLARPHELTDKLDAVPLKVTQGQITFENLCFSHQRSLGSGQ